MELLTGLCADGKTVRFQRTVLSSAYLHYCRNSKYSLLSKKEFGGLAVVPLTTSKDSDIQQVQIPESPYQGRPLSRSGDGSLYIGNGTLLQQYSYINSQVEQISQDLPSACWSFYQDSKQQLWIGLTNALVYKKPEEQQTHYINLGNLQQKNVIKKL